MYVGVNTPLGVGHNPYFNRWFSAMEYISAYILQKKGVTILILIDGFLQYKS